MLSNGADAEARSAAGLGLGSPAGGDVHCGVRVADVLRDHDAGDFGGAADGRRLGGGRLVGRALPAGFAGAGLAGPAVRERLSPLRTRTSDVRFGRSPFRSFQQEEAVLLKVERRGKRLTGFDALQPRSLSELYDLADFVANSPEALFAEVGERLFVVEVGRGDEGEPDLTAVDGEGRLTAVVVESGAADGDSLSRLLNAGSRLAAEGSDPIWSRLTPRRAAELRRFAGVNLSGVESLRLILIVESASESLMRTASWLRAKGGVDVSIMEVALAQDTRSGDEFLRCRFAELPAVGRPAPPPAERAEEAAAAARHETEVGDSPPPSTTLSEDALGDRRTHGRSTDSLIRDLRVTHGGRTYEAECLDYSQGGVGVAMDAPLPRGEAVRVRGELGGRSIDVSGVVRHCRMGDRRYHLGLSFDALQPELL